ncbi:hypothetical protein [Actinoplanes siamensis]|uniref:Alpha/beta hydrolase n=1 Tax=Actinoplanes siamensis TaxID=1223317 RepID=A0A919TNS9_9ACTN|nr:hypothetical protein [Actinoplanes siamensis]GIF08483.1 hypothetical protein Asi03nite_60210 [Actinoplanes siamensis]
MSAKTDSRGRGSRLTFGRLPFAAIIIVVMAASLGVAAALSSTSGKPQPSANAVTEVKDPCEDAREMCATLPLNGREWRYSLVKASTATRRTAILDLGGPGIAPLSGTYHLSDYAAQLPQLSGYNLLVIEEPWVTQSLDDSCAEALAAYYGSVRAAAGDIPDRAAALQRICEIGQGRWGFTPQEYAQVVNAVTTHESLDLEGFVGHSFGAARYSYLTGAEAAENLKWAVLARPFPVGTDAVSFATRRAQLIEKDFGTAPGAYKQQTVESRSLPVTSFDAASAFVGLGYAAEAEQSEATDAVMKKRTPEVIGEFSDNLWHRYGTNSVSPAFLAQLDEVCSATTSSEKLKAGLPDDVTSRIVTELMLPCAGEPSRELSLPAAKTCVTSSKTDPVVAGDTAAGLIKRVASDVIIYESRAVSHNSQDGLSYCMTKVLGAA